MRWAMRQLWNWLERKDLEQRMRHASAHYALCIASGDEGRAKRLQAVLRDLRAEMASVKHKEGS